MNATELHEPFSCPAFDDIQKWYRPAHGYVSLVVCIFGCVANLLNIIVLTRREMSSPTNAILTGLAVTDFLVMLEYIPFSWHMYLRKSQDLSYGWGLFVLGHSHFGQVFHTISIWLTITLAVWRYIAVVYPQRNREWCGMQRTILAIASGYIISPILNIPLFLAFDIQPRIVEVDEKGVTPTKNSTGVHNTTVYVVNVSELGAANNYMLADINIWVYSVVIKIIPCIALTALSGGLICALMEAKKRRDALISGSRKTPRNVENERQTDRTTRMLLAVLLLFLITEFPQGILGLLSVILGKRFLENCYNKIGETMDMLALLNSAINFMIYCAMSRQFRTTFSVLFRPRWLPVPQVDNGVNHNHTTTMVTQV